MARPGAPNRIRLPSLPGATKRKAMSRALAAPLLRWRASSIIADQLLILPQELRTPDPSFWHEVEMGQFGLAGASATLKGQSPFDLDPPTGAWRRALHGFEWLHHLESAHDERARDAARRLVQDWIAKTPSGTGLPWRPETAARRLLSWLSHANMLLENADGRAYAAVTASLGQQLAFLAGSWRDAPVGYPRLVVLLALTACGLCIAGHERELKGWEKALGAELARQILPDGGHVTRNPAVLVEVLLDLLPVRQCFATRGRPPPDGLDDRIRRMLGMLRYLRMGDGMLARFNGVSAPAAAGLATVLAYDDHSLPPLKWAQASNYARIQCAESVVVMDAGAPPPLELSADAHAGCLSFEMSIGTRLLFVNCGAPPPINADWRSASRATASHNTLCLGETSSATLVRHAGLETLIGSPPIRSPENVSARVGKTEQGATIEGHHDGYARRYGLLHRRVVALDAKGDRIEGMDRIETVDSRSPPGSRLYAIHFHLHPNVSCYHANPGVAAEIVLDNDRQWRFSVQGATLSIEESIFYADSAGPRPSQQIVLRGSFPAESEIRWKAVARD